MSEGVDFVVVNLDATDREIYSLLIKLGFYGELGYHWLRMDMHELGYRDVWAYPTPDRVLFRAEGDKKQLKIMSDSAIALIKAFGGELYDSRSGQTVPIELTKEERIENLERMLLK